MSDLISREAVLNLYEEYRPRLATHVCEFEDALKGIPPVEPKGDLISKEEALELFPLILTGELLSIETVRHQLRKLQTVEAVPLSVIEKIHDAVDNADSDDFYEDEHGYIIDSMLTIEHIHEIISKEVKECTHE